MISRLLYPLFALMLLIGCTNPAPRKNKVDESKQRIPKKNLSVSTDKDNPLEEFDEKNIKQRLNVENGVSVEWIASPFKSNPTLKDGEVCLLSYRLTLPDGKIIDGNNRIKLPFIPYLVGYNMQIAGWDLGMHHLRVGDFAKVIIPAEMAYGSKGIKNIVPSNSEVWLYVKVLAKVSPDGDKNGVKYWVFDKGAPTKLDGTEDKEIFYHAIASTKSNPNVQNTYRKHLTLSYVPGARNVVPGLRSLLKAARPGQKIFALLSSEQAYGKQGYGALVQPNESVFYNLTIRSVREL
ncbi:MAG: FKBP-type peptidyl-prolyl cis-trans isomerase [Bacteroidetes bacterium]|nr:FKBP-type peptidyl-prolyl cis-trans isomerase [Bacteroidota bacterium]